MKKLSFTSTEFDERFNYATSIRESTLEFCNKEISGKEWLNVAYDKKTKIIIKRMLRNYGIKGTRVKMRRYCGKFSWMGDYK